MVPEQIEREIVIDAPVARVWDVLTQTEHVQQWFAFDGAEIDLRPGGAMVMRWQEHGTYHARIALIEPPRLFAYRAAQIEGELPHDGNSTLVEFTLSAEGDGTRLRVVESGFRGLDIPEAERAAQVQASIEGWQGAFSTLGEYAARVAA